MIGGTYGGGGGGGATMGVTTTVTDMVPYNYVGVEAIRSNVNMPV